MQNIIVLGTHNSHAIPYSLRQHLSPEYKRNPALLQNYSDPAIARLDEAMPDIPFITPELGRFLDPNRVPYAPD